MAGLLQDVRFAIRSLIKRPGFTAVAALTLALGIGANTTIFSLVHGILLKPLPYPGADRIVEIWNRWDDSPQARLADPEFLAYREQGTSFEAMAAFGFGTANLTGGGEPERLSAVWSSAGIFTVLGAEPVRGRFFSAEEDQPGGEAVAVVSHELWQRRFGGDPDLVGTAIQLDGVPVTVIGIAPAGVRPPSDHRRGTRTDVWYPLQLDAADPGSWGSHYLLALGRLAPGVTLASAQAELDLAVERMKQTTMADANDAVNDPAFGVALWPVLDQIVGPVRPALLILLGAVGLVLAIACANVANLMVVRGESRRHEIALRAAVGASRFQLLRQLLIESLLLAALGGVAGGILATWGHSLFLGLLPPEIPRLAEVAFDGNVLIFAVLVALATGLLAGFLPAIRTSGADLGAALRAGRGSGHGRDRGRLRNGLVISEVALAMVLVICAGLLIRSFWKLQGVDPGYRTDDVLTLRLELPGSAYPEDSDVAGFYDRLRHTLAAIPGVESVGAVTHLPLAMGRGDWNFYPEDRVIAPGERSPRGDWQVVTPGYFETLGITVVEGRGPEDRDAVGAPPVLIVNQSLAEKYWPDSSPVGVRARLGGNDDNPHATIVGVVADIRYEGLDRPAVPEIYIPHAQAPDVMGRGPARSLTLLLRAAGPEALMPTVRSEIAALDDDLPVADLRTLAQVRSGSMALSRVSMALLSGFAVLALVLGAVGIFGVVSYLVARRTREIGVRMALGARRQNVVGLVVGAGMRLALAGLAVGLVAAFALTRLLGSLLYAVAPADPATFATVALVLALVAFCASYLPARRASGIDPIEALRDE